VQSSKSTIFATPHDVFFDVNESAMTQQALPPGAGHARIAQTVSPGPPIMQKALRSRRRQHDQAGVGGLPAGWENTKEKSRISQH
jgi:hypothetical protein